MLGLNFLKASSFKEPIKDPTLIESSYKYWRIRIFYSMFLGYALFYFTRKSYNFVMPVMLEELSYTKAELGKVGAGLYIAYGISKFVSGMMAEYSNPRYFLSVGLIITGFLNIFFGASTSLYAFAAICALNGWFQGWGWPACTKLLTYWYSRKERGTWWSVCSTSHGLGGMLIPIYAGGIASAFGWRMGMYLPGALCILAGLVLMERLRDIPQSMGLPPIEDYKNDWPTKIEHMHNEKHEHVSNLSLKNILFDHVLNNRFVWMMSLSYFFVYVVRTAVNDWGHIFLREAKGYTILQANFSITWFEIGGILGMLVAGLGSDTLLRGKRLPIILAYTLGLIVALPLYWYIPAGMLWLDYIVMTVIGFLIFGPQMLVGLAVAEIVDKRAACTANGFAGFCSYLGAAASTYPIGCILDKWNWNGYFVSLLICTVAILIFASLSEPKRGENIAVDANDRANNNMLEAENA